MTEGETVKLPLVAPPVENPVPTHEETFAPAQASVEDPPGFITVGVTVRDTKGVEDGIWKAPMSKPAEAPVEVTANSSSEKTKVFMASPSSRCRSKAASGSASMLRR